MSGDGVLDFCLHVQFLLVSSLFTKIQFLYDVPKKILINAAVENSFFSLDVQF